MIKYRIPYFDLKNNSWRVELSNASYSGDVIILNTSQGQGCTIQWSADDDPYEDPIISSSASFTVVKHNLGLIDVKELKNSSDFDWAVDVYKNEVLFWTGYLVPDGIQEYYQSLPYDVQLSATDGLKLLSGKTFSTNNWLLPDAIVQRSFISHVRDILFKSDQLGKPLPIRWTGFLQNKYDNGTTLDAFTKTTFSPTGDGYHDLNSNPYSSFYILENYLRAYACRLYQAGGKWRIDRIPDVPLDGDFDWSEIDTTYSPTVQPILTTGTENKLKDIGVDYLVGDGAYTLNMPGLNKVTATYEANKPENIVPNGTFDKSGIAPIGWAFSNGVLDFAQVDSINGRAGYSCELTYPANATGAADTENFALRSSVGAGYDSIPLDTAVIFKRLSFGFTFMPQNGFPYDTSTGNIVWDSGPLRVLVLLEAIGTTTRTYCLNENGFWIPKPTGDVFQRYNIIRNVVGSAMHVDGYYQGHPMVGDNITYSCSVNNTSVTAYCTAEFNGDIAGFLDYAGQYFVDNLGSEVISYSIVNEGSGGYSIRLITEYHGTPDSGYDITSAMAGTNRDGSISILPGSATRIGDVIQINFDKYQGIKMPDFSDDSGHLYARINIFFYVNKGQRYTIDDVYLTADDNNEVYEYQYDNKFSKTEDYSLKISTSKSGVYASNIMTAYYNSYRDSKYIDSTGYVGTLTDLYARSVIRSRSKSLELFEGNLLNSDDFEFGYLYTIEGFGDQKMLSLSASYNTETCETQIGCYELNTGDTSFTRRFYGSNDKPLSNQIVN